MVAGFIPEQKDLTRTQLACAGVVAGCLARCISQPFDVIKIRFQLQVEPIRATSASKYSGLFQAVRAIVREEKFKSLWKGHLSGQLLSLNYTVAQFYSIEMLTKLVYQTFPSSATDESLRNVSHFSCGFAAGCIATIVAQPVDVLRTRMVAQGEPKVYRGLADATVTMFKKEGIFAFYKGLVPTLITIGPQTGFMYLFYRLLMPSSSTSVTSTTINSMQTNRDSHTLLSQLRSLMSGSVAGVLAKIIVFPGDLVKKRLQVTGFEDARKVFGSVHYYDGMLHCIRTIMKLDGFRGFYKGLVPSLFKAAIMAGSTFYFYDSTCYLFRRYA